MHSVVICDAVRTPIGRFQGGLSDVRPDDLAALTIAEVVRRAGVEPAAVEEVVFGCANQAGEDNRNVARMAALLAGMPQSVPGVTVNRLCASGLEAVVQAARAIRCGDQELVVAGGVESMSRAPYSLPRGGQHPKAGNLTVWDTSLGWRYPNPKMEALFPLEPMGMTAENLVDRYGITRADQDAFALRSHQRAAHAWAQGWFNAEVTPVTVKSGKATTTLSQDEGPRADTSLESLGRLAPAFRDGGSVTAGNSSTLNDGAAAVLLASDTTARERGLRARARWIGAVSAGVDPRVMGIGPVPAVRKLLARHGLVSAQIDAWELNEAFAAQSLAVIRELDLDLDRVNVQGGAIALGHPLGCSGARILTTLLGVLERTGGRFGVATLCVGVGQGLAALIERVEPAQA
jgi:acetyl-CoA C-acetyltransferase